MNIIFLTLFIVFCVVVNFILTNKKISKTTEATELRITAINQDIRAVKVFVNMPMPSNASEMEE